MFDITLISLNVSSLNLDNDYEPWMAHATLRSGEGPEMKGCLLGVKETFMRLKQDSW